MDSCRFVCGGPLNDHDRVGRVTASAEFLRIIGEAANKARVAMSTMDTNTCEKLVTWNGVNMPRAARKRRANAGFWLNRLRIASVMIATDTTAQTRVRYSKGERNSTASAKVRVASNATSRVTMHTPECTGGES